MPAVAVASSPELVGIDGRTIAFVARTELVEVLDADGRRTVMSLRDADSKIAAALGKPASEYIDIKRLAVAAAAAAFALWALTRRSR
jgi:hypothetical protein